MLARERRGDGHLPAGVPDQGFEARAVQLESFAPDERRRLEPEGDRGHGQLGDEALSPGIVLVDDGRPLLGVEHEELLLGREIVLHRLVVVQVLAAEVGEDGHVEADARDPLEVERVGGDLHDAVGHAVVEHGPEHPLEVGRFGRRPLGFPGKRPGPGS